MHTLTKIIRTFRRTQQIWITIQFIELYPKIRFSFLQNICNLPGLSAFFYKADILIGSFELLTKCLALLIILDGSLQATMVHTYRNAGFLHIIFSLLVHI